ncbi:hypothetical protein QTP70_005439 [Hemibagrus guttatus]|uniref:Claudin n=1 Tax=Hemibagrus guttatus TaxID=175788 RepID=A0AAE0R3Y1_9TELE|nr:hypothetical protein QTP70_005439 [Hemibagrus guttatus]
MDYWRVSYIGGQGGSWIIKAAWYWSTLWRDCYIDTSDVANCRDFDIMWVVRPGNRAEQGAIQAVRALLLLGMFLGLFAAIFCFIGMDCTYIGGHAKTKYKILLIGTVLHFTGGVSCLAAYCLFTGRLGTITFTRMPDARLLRYYIGLPVFFGLVGSAGILLGSVLYAVTLCSVLTSNSNISEMKEGYPFDNIYISFKEKKKSHQDLLLLGMMKQKDHPDLLCNQKAYFWLHVVLLESWYNLQNNITSIWVLLIMAHSTYIHLCRALIIIAILLGLFGAILALVGMKCTKLGGSEVTNAKVTFAAGINYLTSGLCSVLAYSCYGYRVVSEFLDPNYQAQKFELGPALYIGWGGSVLLIAGGLIFSIFGGKEGCHSSSMTNESLAYPTEVTGPSKPAKNYLSRRPQIESKRSGRTTRNKGYKKEYV